MAIDSYRFLDFASRQVMKAWAARQDPGAIPFTPLAKPLRECTVALVSTAGVARNDDRPFDQEGKRRNPWWGDPCFRAIPLAPTHYSVMGYILQPTELVEQTAPAITGRMRGERVDAAALFPV